MIPSGMLGRIFHRRDPPPPDPTLTKEYRVGAIAASDEETMNTIYDGCGPRKFDDHAASLLPPYGGLRGDMADLDLYCGMSCTYRHVAPLVREYHGVDFAGGMIENAREYGRSVLKGWGLFFAQLPRADLCRGAQYTLTNCEIRCPLSGFASSGGSIDKRDQCRMARAVKGAG